MEFRQRRRADRLHPLRWLLAVSAGWFALILSSPMAPLSLALVAYALGGVVCHQIPGRSFHAGAVQMAVCARCTGIYAGAAASFLWQAWRERDRVAAGADAGSRHDRVLAARLWLFGGMLPTLMTVGLEYAGLWQTSNSMRAAAGVPLGATVALVAGRAATLHYEQWRQRRLV